MTRSASDAATFGVNDVQGIVTPTTIPKKRITQVLMLVAQSLWPVKTDLYLSAHAQTCDRACRAWLKGDAGMSLDAFDNLLCSDAGLSFLRALMQRRSVKPAWWHELEEAAELADLLRRQKAQRRLLDES